MCFFSRPHSHMNGIVSCCVYAIYLSNDSTRWTITRRSVVLHYLHRLMRWLSKCLCNRYIRYHVRYLVISFNSNDKRWRGNQYHKFHFVRRKSADLYTSVLGVPVTRETRFFFVFQYPIKYKNTSENKCRIVESHRELLSSTIYTHLLAGRCHRSQTIATQPANNNRGLRKCRKFIPSWSVRSCTVTHCQQQTNTDIICYPYKWINAFFMCAVAVIRRLYFFYIINILLLLLFLLLLVPWFMIRQIWQWPCFVCLLHACALCVSLFESQTANARSTKPN